MLCLVNEMGTLPGIGIPQDIIGRIFEPFVTSKKNGVGLGLAIASRIITDHNGIIVVDNKRR